MKPIKPNVFTLEDIKKFPHFKHKVKFPVQVFRNNPQNFSDEMRKPFQTHGPIELIVLGNKENYLPPGESGKQLTMRAVVKKADHSMDKILEGHEIFIVAVDAIRDPAFKPREQKSLMDRLKNLF